MKRDILIVKSSNPPIVEIDSQARAAYVRFKNTKVAKTISEDKEDGLIVAIDLDKDGDVVGVEIIGVSEFGVRELLLRAPVTAPKIDLSKARYVAADCVEA